jgi:hypothetical protein
VKHQERCPLAVAIGSDRREVFVGAIVDGALEGLGPEVRESGGANAEAEKSDTHARRLVR